MATDQEIRDAGLKYIPQQKYLQNPYELPIAPVPTVEGGGITNTNAFTNSGGNDFNPAGNAFGYGTPVSEVNVRTFNPQELPGAKMPSELGFSSNTIPLGNNRISASQLGIDIPGGQVNNTYNRARNAMGARGDDTMSRDYPDFTAAEVARLSNNSIQDYRQNYQANYNSPYDDTVDLGYLGRDTSTSLEGRIGKDGIRRKSSLGKAIDFVTNFIPGVGAVKKGAKFIGGLLPDNPNGPGGGSYGIAGLSDDKKAAYNALAGGNMLFDGQQGFKTSTGKNFGATNYVPNQLELYEELKDEKDLTPFQKRQLLEASAVYKATQAQKQKQKEEFDKPGGTGEQVAALQKEIDSGKYSGGSDFAQSNQAAVGGGDTATNAQGQTASQATSAGTGTSQGYSQHYARGGRAGYFFGGRVNFKDGGLAGLL